MGTGSGTGTPVSSAVYTTAAAIRALTSDASLSAAYDTLLTTLAERASRLVDRLTRREDGAYQATASADRYFDASGSEHLPIDEAVSVSAVACRWGSGAEWTELASTDWRPWPPNYASLGRPIIRLDIDRRQGTYGAWPSTGRESVKVTAVWGYSASPPPIVAHAVAIQALRWFRRGQQMYADVNLAGAQLGVLAYAEELDPEVRTLIIRSGLVRGTELF